MAPTAQYDEGMARDGLRQLGERLLAGELSLDDFIAGVGRSMVADLCEAKLDLDRPRRCGFPEVIFAPGKSVAVLERLFAALLEHGGDVLATRVSAEQAAELLPKFPSGRYNAVGRTFRIESKGWALQRRVKSQSHRNRKPKSKVIAEESSSSPPARATCPWPRRPAKRPCGPGPT